MMMMAVVWEQRTTNTSTEILKSYLTVPDRTPWFYLPHSLALVKGRSVGFIYISSNSCQDNSGDDIPI